MTEATKRSASLPGPLPRRQFASDNYSGICPEAWQALEQANRGHAIPYGDDPWCKRATDQMRELFETDCEVFFVFNGTAANSLALAALCQPYHSILCHDFGHIETDECGAPEFLTGGAKILHMSGRDGKIVPEEIEYLTCRRRDIHYPRPHALSLTQATELGLVYTQEELAALCAAAHGQGLHVHMDGARFANAVASRKCRPADLSWRAGVDVLSFGGGKNGMGAGEAVVFFRQALAKEFDYRCKQAGQLASKMRFLAAPWMGMIESGAWLRNAAQANRMAARLAAGLREQKLSPEYPVEANSVFLQFPEAVARRLEACGWRYYTFIGGAARLMCSWDTTESDVDALLADIASCVPAGR